MINIMEVTETNKMVEKENLDVRTITMGINLLDCAGPDLAEVNEKIYNKITTLAKDLVSTGEEIAKNRPSAVYESSLSRLTFCVLVLKNGFTVTGESACASPENFDAEIGRKIARENAINKVWPLMGYELKTKLSTKE